MAYLLLTGVFVAGVIVGSIMTQFFFRYKTTKGTMIVDLNNPEKDVFRLELADIDEIPESKHIILDVVHSDSQK